MKSARYENSSIMVLLPDSFPINNQFLGIFIELLKEKMEELQIHGEPAIYQIENYPGQFNVEQGVAQLKLIEKVLSHNNVGLSCIIGDIFSNPDANRILARQSDKGMRILVFSNDIEYKHLAENLGVSNIKHKARIEKIDFNNPDDDSISLLSDVIDDELRRVAA